MPDAETRLFVFFFSFEILFMEKDIVCSDFLLQIIDQETF